MAKLRGDERSRYVTRMFARISRRYDMMNTVMTAGRHYAWRRMATDMAVGEIRGPALDVATGTGDFAFDLARKPSVSRVVGLDYTPEMLAIAIRKAERNGVARTKPLSFVVGDAHALPFDDAQFICATVGFGVRNFIDVPKALREMARVVMPGGKVVILEIVRVEGKGPWKRLFPFYFRRVMPLLGGLLAGDREAYSYLPESVQAFRSASEFTHMMKEAGLQHVRHRKLALGTVAIHVGEKEIA